MGCWWCLSRKAMLLGGFSLVLFYPALLLTVPVQIPSLLFLPAIKWKVTSEYGSWIFEIMTFMYVCMLLMTEDEMVGWHHWLNGHESGWTPGVGDGQGGLACCRSWGRKESDTTERLNWTDAADKFFSTKNLNIANKKESDFVVIM